MRYTTVDIPPVPPEWTGWRRTLRRLDRSKSGGFQVTGESVSPGARLANGTAVVTYEKTVTGQNEAYHGGGTYAVYSATVRLLVADDRQDTGFTEVYTRTSLAKTAFSDTVLTRLDAILTTLSTCRHCAEPLGPGPRGLTGTGRAVRAEHDGTCPDKAAEPGDPCDVCGVTLTGPKRFAIDPGRRTYDRRTKTWTTRHTTDCATTPIPSKEDQEESEARLISEQRAADRRAEEQRKADEAERVARLAAERLKRARRADEAHAAEVARVAGLDVVGRVSTTPYDKSLGDGRRARLIEHLDALSDGTTTKSWTVETYASAMGGASFGEDYDGPEPQKQAEDFTRLDWARTAYKTLCFTPAPGRDYQLRRVVVDVPCPGAGVKHCDHCGGTRDEGGWMVASLGLACGQDCCDRMSDRVGRHAERHH